MLVKKTYSADKQSNGYFFVFMKCNLNLYACSILLSQNSSGESQILTALDFQLKSGLMNAFFEVYYEAERSFQPCKLVQMILSVLNCTNLQDLLCWALPVPNCTLTSSIWPKYAEVEWRKKKSFLKTPPRSSSSTRVTQDVTWLRTIKM